MPSCRKINFWYRGRFPSAMYPLPLDSAWARDLESRLCCVCSTVCRLLFDDVWHFCGRQCHPCCWIHPLHILPRRTFSSVEGSPCPASSRLLNSKIHYRVSATTMNTLSSGTCSEVNLGNRLTLYYSTTCRSPFDSGRPTTTRQRESVQLTVCRHLSKLEYMRSPHKSALLLGQAGTRCCGCALVSYPWHEKGGIVFVYHIVA